MKSYDAMNIFAAQLERHIIAAGTKTKVVVTPSAVNEKGIRIEVSLLKCWKRTLLPHVKSLAMIRVRVRVAGAAESMTALEMACDTIDALDDYLGCKEDGDRSEGNTLLLEDAEGNPISNTRIRTEISAEDSFVPTPDSTEVQDVEDDRICSISFPWEKLNGKMDDSV